MRVEQLAGVLRRVHAERNVHNPELWDATLETLAAGLFLATRHLYGPTLTCTKRNWLLVGDLFPREEAEGRSNAAKHVLFHSLSPGPEAQDLVVLMERQIADQIQFTEGILSDKMAKAAFILSKPARCPNKMPNLGPYNDSPLCRARHNGESLYSSMLVSMRNGRGGYMICAA